MILLTILIGAAIAWPLVDYLSATASEAFQSDERGFVFGPETIDEARGRQPNADGPAASVCLSLLHPSTCS